MEIDQSITRNIEPEREKTRVTNQGDTLPMSVGKILILSFLPFIYFIFLTIIYNLTNVTTANYTSK